MSIDVKLWHLISILLRIMRWSSWHCGLDTEFESWALAGLRWRKWNESGFRPPLCTYRLNWARRTSWGWWDEWDDTVLQTQDSKFEPWRSEAEHATFRSRRFPTILTFTRGWGRNNFCFFQTAESGSRTPNSGVKGSGANHYPRAPALWGRERYLSATEALHNNIVILASMTILILANERGRNTCSLKPKCQNGDEPKRSDIIVSNTFSPRGYPFLAVKKGLGLRPNFFTAKNVELL